MSIEVTHETAKNQYVEANGTRYAYRRFGAKGGIPLVFCHRFRATIDEWDPEVVNAFAKEREVILFNSAGVGSSSGEIPTDIPAMADHAIAFITALGLPLVDLLGFSMGGYVATTVTLNAPKLVRKLILAGTGPGGGEGILPGEPEVRPVSGRPVLGLEEYLFLFFAPSESSQQAGQAYWERLKRRPGESEPALSPQAVERQVAAVTSWSKGVNSAFPRLGEIDHEVLITNGHRDIMVPTLNSFTMSQRVRRAQLIIYPDSGHGFLFQYPKLFTTHALEFLRAR